VTGVIFPSRLVTDETTRSSAPSAGVTGHAMNRLADIAPPIAPAAFSVVLGPDYAGKSTLLTEMAGHGMHCVSYDKEFVGRETALINDLRGAFLKRALPAAGDVYSRDFVVTLLQTSVIYLRDEMLRAAAGDRPVVVDSYYYKVLAKCRLTGLVNEQMFGWWRAFPQPGQVIFIDVDTRTAWRRCDRGARLNPFEYYGATPTFDGFRAFQDDLRRLLVEEVGALPVNRIDGGDRTHRAVAVAQRAARSDDAPSSRV
jgi:thymidylate kinase